jgi:hypothetical protein
VARRKRRLHPKIALEREKTGAGLLRLLNSSNQYILLQKETDTFFYPVMKQLPRTIFLTAAPIA